VAAALFGDSAADTPSPKVGRYEVIEKLGAGGMGVVFRARDPELDRAVALKLLTPDTANDETARKRMVREARALARLSDPNVVQVYDVGTRGDEVFVAMEFIDGQDLAAWLKQGERRWEDTLDIFLEAAKGLAAAHAEGLVHRDFKPANVLVGRDGRVVVVDFGLARPVDPMALPLLEGATTHAGALVGTPMYMAPEQFEGGHADARSDQFAFCVALYHSLYGVRPFAGDNVAAYVSNVIHGRIVDVDAAAKIPAELSSEIRRGLTVAPEGRHADMHSLVEALRRASGRSVDGSSASSSLGGVAGTRRPVWLWSIPVLLAAAFVGWYLQSTPVEAPAVAAAVPATRQAESETPLSGGVGGVQGSDEAESAASTSTQNADSEEESGAATGQESGGPEAEAGPESGTGEGAGETGVGAEPVVRKNLPPRDWCAFHEDNYTLIRRATKKRSRFEKSGTCYTCRVERRRSRIARLHPSDCGGYQLCTAEACK
jgi:predicted Ser/Thr protein kinase